VNGVEYEGDWAWTAPAGCRLPDESVYPAAIRELAEEAGITGHDVWPVDLCVPAEGGYTWSVFGLDVPVDQPIELVDPEHDRWSWLSANEAVQRVRPLKVADVQVRRLVDVPAAAVAGWWGMPHVAPWFRGEASAESDVAARLLPRVRGEVPVRMWVFEVDGAAAGYAQTYRVGDHADYAAKTGDPDAVAFDYVLGDPALGGVGLGTRMVGELCRDVLRRDHPDAVHLIASPSHRNAPSLRVLEKCGFTQGVWIDTLVRPGETSDAEIVCTLDVRHYFG
jgi:RimJ/RimL family protein N-acetyltransferase